MRKLMLFSLLVCVGMAVASCPGKQAEVFVLMNDNGSQLPVVVVRGTPFQMGLQYGQAMREDITVCVDRYYAYALDMVNEFLQDELELDIEVGRPLINVLLDASWTQMLPWVDDRFIAELRGIAAGSGVGFDTIRRLHTMPVLVPYSCTSICAWHTATSDTHLYQTRNLAYSIDAGLQDHACIVVYRPDAGYAHANFTFAGLAGVHTGLSERGLVLTEMDDSPDDDMPYDVKGHYFMFFFRSIMYDAMNLGDIETYLRGLDHIKKYHYVFGDGVGEAVGTAYGGQVGGFKMRAYAPDDDFHYWYDNDPTDEFAPGNDRHEDGYIAPCIVYNDEGRGRPTTRQLLRTQYGDINERTMYEIARSTRINNSNLCMAIFDATDLEGWIRFATQTEEAYETAPFYFDMKEYLD